MRNGHYGKSSSWQMAIVYVLLYLFVSASASHAQDSGAAVDMTGMGIYAMEDAVKEAARSTNPTHKKTVSNKATVRKQIAVLTFTPSVERRRKNLAAFVARARATNPQAGESLERNFADGDIIRKMNQELVKIGLKPNNVADAYAAWWLSAWLASRSRWDTPPRAQIAAVRSQTVQALQHVPAIASASDAMKQQMAEGFLIQSAIIGGLIEQSKNNPAQLKAIATNVRQGAQAMGLDLDTLNLTNKGFEKRL